MSDEMMEMPDNREWINPMASKVKRCKHCWHSGLREVTVIPSRSCDSQEFKYSSAVRICCKCAKEKK